MHRLSFTSIVLLRLTFLPVLLGAKWTYTGLVVVMVLFTAASLSLTHTIHLHLNTPPSGRGTDGADQWYKHYPYCAGAFQSPINIKSELLRFDSTLRPIEVQNYNLSPAEQLTLGNNGHSVQISLPSKMYISSLPHRYTAAQLHFHWGSSNRPTGSEHMVNSKQYAAENLRTFMRPSSSCSSATNKVLRLELASRVNTLRTCSFSSLSKPLEPQFLDDMLSVRWNDGKLNCTQKQCKCEDRPLSMHIVHFNSDKYSNMSMAVDKSDGLAVLGVLIEIGEFNPAFEQFLKLINNIKYRDERMQISGFNIRALLPARLDEYYRYDGSLTTPPCYPSVLWTIFRNHVTISRKQFLSLATGLYSSHAQDSAPVPLHTNDRKPQPADRRLVLVSFKEGRGLHGILTVTSPLTRKQIVQQLLVGDLADLADEGLYQLLPSGLEKLQAGMKKGFKTLAKSKQHMLNPSLLKKSQTNRSVGKTGLAEDALCYVTMEQRVLHQLRQSHTETQLVQTLRDAVFPELNLKSYLDCKSDLALPTIRHILRGRPPTDEAFELNHSLAKAWSQRKTSTATKQGVPTKTHGGLSPNAAPKKTHSQGYPHPWLLPMEWED